MDNVTPPPSPPATGGEGENQGGASVCDRLRDRCLQDLQTSGCSCRGDSSGGGNDGSGGSGENAGGNDGNGESGDGDDGSGNDGGVRASGGNPDNKFVGGPPLAGYNGKKVDSAAECLRACTDYPEAKCKRAVWSNQEKPACSLYGWGNFNGDTPCNPKTSWATNRDRSHALQEGCPQERQPK
ncbi:uncharacterized protein N7496_005946 [Penicillium cataractarum]|uniref:Apple domain-containing protein n=1 Tax=Penicillium cataractarum TaxID=2100454 RepID=A0A9W9S2I9_9EURO|nr:uncharacterized protein N7496_005946 [Penicillium cataractarum]KAJ5369854.1 hypothetical protein N7496_005946 [Penicillium cataractarum]